jgi:succinoglycan biosynthesis protein ExoM
MTDTIIDICIATFRRPYVVETLASLARVEHDPSWQIRVIVADNDDTPSAEKYVRDAVARHKLDLTYVHAPSRNISIARNACLNAATGTHIVFIDDDEIVSPVWLHALMTTHRETAADMVLGPVQAIYGNDCPNWIRRGDFHSTRPVWVNGEIVTGYMGNALMRRDAAALNNLRFRDDLGRSGGEDTAFCAAYHRAGGRIAYAPDALATEIVLPERATFKWLLKRRYRFGQIHGLMLMETGRAGIKAILKAAAKSAISLIMAIILLPVPDRARFWALRAALHAGVVARLLGQRELQLYEVKS